MIEEIQEAVTIPVMAKARIGHFVEAQVLEALEVDYIDESEVLTPADEAHHIDKWAFKVPFVCGATNLGEALRRIAEGAAMIRSKGEAGTGNVVEAVRHIRLITGEIRRLGSLDADGAADARPRSCRRRSSWCATWPSSGRLPVVLFCAGGIATPADAALMMQLGAEGNFVGSGIFKSEDPERTRPRDRRGHHALRRPRARGRRLARAGRGDARHRDRRARGERRPAAEPRLVSRGRSVGVLALQGGFEAHARALARARRASARGAHAGRPRRARRRW